MLANYVIRMREVAKLVTIVNHAIPVRWMQEVANPVRYVMPVRIVLLVRLQ